MFSLDLIWGYYNLFRPLEMCVSVSELPGVLPM